MFVHDSFKLFVTEDKESGRLMRPEEILRLRPRPEYVLYEYPERVPAPQGGS